MADIIQLESLIQQVISIAFEAGKEIMTHYSVEKTDVVYKADQSPLTQADQAAHQVIVTALSQVTPNIPIISEEGASIPFEVRQNWPYFWLVDPLDGTKEFIKKNGEFTVNIALIKNKTPVLGVVFAPASHELFWATETQGSFLYISEQTSEPLKQKKTAKSDTCIVLGSRSHNNSTFDTYIDHLKTQYAHVEVRPVGSSLKFCRVAQGKADLYPRLGPTMEWDTAAGHAIAKYSGCSVIDQETGCELGYNKMSLLNAAFELGPNSQSEQASRSDKRAGF